jgi:Trypsin-like peptidase domain
MFQRACEIIEPCVCSVGSRRKVFGTGCLIDNNLVLTAGRVQRCHKGKQVVTVGADAYGAELVFQSRMFDVAVLRLLSPVEPISAPLPPDRPAVSVAPPHRGVSVGFYGELRRGESLLRCFVPTSFSFMMTDAVWALAGGVAEQGFSGGPVFTADGSLCGVIMYMQEFMSHKKGLPLVAPLAYQSTAFHELTRRKVK